jgi:ElaA protein
MPMHNRELPSHSAAHAAIRFMSSSSSFQAASFHPALATLDWRWQPFDTLPVRELYAILMARVDVFVVEQTCPYREIDGADPDAWHLGAWDGAALAGYLRVLPADATYPDVRIGRVLTQPGWRGRRLGHALLAQALERIAVQWPEQAVSLHAQAHLQAFYGALGFVADSEIHDEDGIPHVWMRRA